MVVHDARAGHVRPDDLPVRVRVILVLDTEDPAEHRAREVGDVAGGEHVVTTVGASVLVDDDAVLDPEARCLRELGVRHDPEPCHDRVGLERAAGPRGDAGSRDGGDRLAGEDLDTSFAVVVRHERAESGREQARVEPPFGDDHRHCAPVGRQRRGDLCPDEAAADHDDSLSLAGDPAQPSVVVERPEVDDLAVVAAEPSRPAAGGEQDLLVCVLLALVVARMGSVKVERRDPPPQAKVDSELVGPLPDRALLAPAPELLRQRRSLVRRVRLGTDERYRRAGFAFADCLGRLGAGHPAARDQIARSLHGLDPNESGDV